ncbi:MAG: hypothetical protein C0485_14865 [Pirellula sp.]|nr:hypothetical protein [Pirellula sp.]
MFLARFARLALHHAELRSPQRRVDSQAMTDRRPPTPARQAKFAINRERSAKNRRSLRFHGEFLPKSYGL